MAHKVSGQLGSGSAAVIVSPKKLRVNSVIGNFDYSEIIFGVILNILEILACSGNDKNFACKHLCVKAHGDYSYWLVDIKIFGNLIVIKHHADVSAVSFVPAHSIHVCFAHSLYKGCVNNVFHFLFTNTFSSYSFMLPI